MSRSQIVTLIGVIAAVCGAVGPQVTTLNPTAGAIITIIGVGAAAAGGSLLKKAGRAHVARTGLSLMLVGAVLSSVACGSPSRKTLTRIQQGGIKTAQAIEVNETLPDQLLQAGAISQATRDTLVEKLSAAKRDLKTFNVALAATLSTEKPNLKPLVPLALNLLKRIHALKADVPGWDKFFSAVETSVRVIANYFAITISELRQLGASDAQICSFFGVSNDRTLLRWVEQQGGQHARDDAGE